MSVFCQLSRVLMVLLARLSRFSAIDACERYARLKTDIILPAGGGRSGRDGKGGGGNVLGAGWGPADGKARSPTGILPACLLDYLDSVPVTTVAVRCGSEWIWASQNRSVSHFFWLNSLV